MEDSEREGLLAEIKTLTQELKEANEQVDEEVKIANDIRNDRDDRDRALEEIKDIINKFI